MLLDTHVALWLLADDPSLGPRARGLVRGAPSVHVSAASVWEIEIKRELGKLDAPDDLVDVLARSGVAALPITWAHARATPRTGLGHRDPFDRMLVAQARAERLVLLTADRRILAEQLPDVADARA